MTTPPTATDFFSLVEQSGLLASDRLKPYRVRSGELPTAELAARQLIRDRLLTPFQARLLLRGKFRAFFLTDKFKVLDQLGEGGMGRVLLCEHLVLGKLVAVKVLHAAAEAAPGATERFLREARAAAAINHPNIVSVTDVDRAGTSPFMVLEYVDGTNLHQLVTEGGPLTVNRAVEYTRQAAVGLHAAHMAGLIHRDIKPGNLLLSRSGLIKVLDLGLARFMENASRNDNLTGRFDDNSILGTADFIAPEQTMNSSKVDIRADIYSLGLTFYFLLTGVMPYGDGTPAQKLVWHQLRHPEPVTKVRPGIPAAVQAVLSRMIEKDPAKRYQSPAEVVDALRPLLTGPVAPPPATEMPKVRPSSYLLGISPLPSGSVLAAASANTPGPGTGRTANLGRGSASQVRLNPATGGTRPPRTGATVLDALSDFGADEPENEPAAPQPQPQPAGVSTQRNRLGLVLAGFAALAGVAAVLFAAGVFDSRKPDPSGPVVINRPNNTPPDDKGKQGGGTPAPTTPKFTLGGGGSSFVGPMMNRWAETYDKETSGKGTRVKVEYATSGSSKGVEGVLGGKLLFGCTDAYLSDEQLAGVKKGGRAVVHVPLVMGAVVPTYNLPDVKEQLRFTGGVLADIYLGKITHWDDPAIVASNGGARLPHLPIAPVRRADGSGTTFIWTDFLCETDGAFKDKIGGKPSNKPTWPKGADGKEIGAAGDGNAGVAAEVRKTVGAIGYVELSFALSQSLAYGQVQNREGKFIHPTLDRVTVAASNKLVEVPDDLRYTLTNAPGQGSYPICGTTWAVIYTTPPEGKADEFKEAVKFLRWCVHEGQKYAREEKYAPLPEELIPKIDQALDKLTGDR